MSMMLQPGRFGPSGPPNIAFVESNSANPADTATHTFVAAAIGAVANRSLIVAVIHWVAPAGVQGRTLNSATIGGISATVVVAQPHTTTEEGIAIISAVVPSGTTADIALTFSGLMDRIGYATYKITGHLNSTVALGSDSSTTGVAAFIDTSNGVDTQVDACAVVAVESNTSGKTFTWSAQYGVPPDPTSGETISASLYSAAVGGSRTMAGAVVNNALATVQAPHGDNLYVRSTPSASDRMTIVMASWR